jgi:lipoyl-dependent peroxiredoxin
LRRNRRRAGRLVNGMQTPDEIIRAASVHWEGDTARGKGTIETESGFVKAGYSFGTRFSGDPGTNPEELLAAAHAACFTMAMSLWLTRAGHPPASVDTTARVHLEREGKGMDIPLIALTTTVVAAGLEPEKFQQLATEAKASCPLSRALRAVEITLDARLNP